MTENQGKIEIDLLLYSKEAVLNAMYKFTDRYFIKSESETGNKITLTFSAKENFYFSQETENAFRNEIIDQQIRINVEKEYKTIREEIVKKAFAAINK